MILELAIAILIVSLAMILSEQIFRFTRSYVVAKEYISWYKVGRIMQLAEAHQIDIDEVIAKHYARESKAVRKTWEQRIEDSISENIKDVEEFNVKTASKPSK